MRTRASQLPSFDELSKLLDAEAYRKVPEDKVSQHFGDLSTFFRLLDYFKLPNSIFERVQNFDDLNSAEVYNELTNLLEILVEKTLNQPSGGEFVDVCNGIYDYLSEEDNPQQSDVIFVFGSEQNYRIEKAVQLFKLGLASKICISGRSPFYRLGETQESEAQQLAQYAMSKGVPKDALILEEGAVSTPDNVKRSLNLFEKQNIKHDTILIVNSPFSQRRGWVHFNKFARSGTKIIRVNVDKVSDRFSRDGWYRDEVGTAIILKEFYGLWVSSLLNTS